MPADAVLGIDTATSDVAVACQSGETVLFEERVQPPAGGRPRHSSALLALVGAAVDAAGGWERIEAIAVGLGPGAFTGLRVGIATARALGQARGLPLVGVGSLEALARGIDAEAGRARVAVLDARRREAFALACYPSGALAWGPEVVSPDELASRIRELGDAPIAAGDGSVRFREELEAAGAEVPPDADPMHRMAARNVCALAAGAARVGPEQVRPIYLRRPDAEVWREQQDDGARERA